MMRGGTVQIHWHDTKPVLTLDFHPLSGILATGGADYDIKVLPHFSTFPVQVQLILALGIQFTGGLGFCYTFG